jgi:hypothetical protein
MEGIGMAEKYWQVMLIAPVGTRDVTLTDLSLLPDEGLRQAWNHADPKERTGAWQKGEVLLTDPERYKTALGLEILGKAVRHVYARHGRIDRLVLVASKQPETTQERYRKNDTFKLAEVVKALLCQDEVLKPVGERTKIMVVADNPASYEVMRAFYRKNLTPWTHNLSGEGVCYLEVTGGTAQMSTMLLLEGVRLLGVRAVPLYVLEEYDLPQTLDVGREMLVDSLRHTLERDLAVYAYHAAWRSVVEEEAVLRPSLPHYGALRALLDAARHRLNFDFGAAQRALFGADRGLPPHLARQVLALATELSEQARTPEWLITEVYHSASVRRRTEAYASFVGRVFRFQEAMLRYLCEQWGAQFGGKNDAVLDPVWLEGQPTLIEALKRAEVDPGREVTRRSLRVVAEERMLATGQSARMDWLKRLDRFEQVASLRNQLVITHGFAGVSAERLAELYPGGAPQIEGDMEGLLRDVLAVGVATNPYDAINDLCLALSDGGEA